jgi:hypothetical protein
MGGGLKHEAKIQFLESLGKISGPSGEMPVHSRVMEGSGKRKAGTALDVSSITFEAV